MRLAGTRWRIIKELSRGDRTPTWLAGRLRISVQGVHTHLKQLERGGLVQRAEAEKGKTRPYTNYSLGGGFVHFVEALPGEARKRTLRIDDDVMLHLRLWSLPQQEYHHYVEALWWEMQPHIADIEAVVVYGSVARGDAREGSDIDILLLVRRGVKKYEAKFGARRVGTPERGKMVMCQVFEAEDFRDSLQQGSQFAAEAVKDGRAIYDPHDAFLRLKDESAAGAGEKLPRRGRAHP